jgi:hypothetical protein
LRCSKFALFRLFPHRLFDIPLLAGRFSISTFLNPTFSQIDTSTVSVPDYGQELLAGSQDPFFWGTQDNLNDDPFAGFQERLDQDPEDSSWHPTSNNLAPYVPISLSESNLLDTIFSWDEPLSLSTITPTNGVDMGAQSESSLSMGSSTGIPSCSSDPPGSADEIRPPASDLSSRRSYSITPSFSESPQGPKKKKPPCGHSCLWNGCLEAFDEISQLRYDCSLFSNNLLLTRDP